MSRKPLLQCLRDPEKRTDVRRPETGSAIPGFPGAEKVNSGNQNIIGVNPRPNREWFRNTPF